MCPRVRATFGRRSGPMTTSATTAMTMISEKPISNTFRDEVGLSRRRAKRAAGAAAAAGFGGEAGGYEVFSFLTSPSMVLPPICWGVSSGAGCASVSLVFMPSLKPFTAPPKSWPMLRSFLVPKMSTTTSRTISQCQMLNPPMLSPFEPLSSPRQHRTQHVRSAYHVHVEVHDFLPADAPGVDDGPEAVGRTVFAREPARQREQPAEHRRIVVADLRQRIDVLFRYQHEVHRRLRPDVVERQ